jgi:acyl-CoA reductase-like NAD-dependent aldehyde dehydrogenase
MRTQLSACHWIGGEWVDSATRQTSIDPATSETIGTYADAGAQEALRAIEIARQVFLHSDWRNDRRLRAKVLNEMADRFESCAQDLIAILCLENGKIEGEARFEVSMVPSKLRFYASLALSEFGRAIEVAPGRYSMTMREPLGVAGIIAPWNSPVVASAVSRKIEPQRRCGDDVNIEFAKADAGSGADALKTVAHDVQSVLGGVEQDATRLRDGEAAQARRSGGDRDGQVRQTSPYRSERCCPRYSEGKDTRKTYFGTQ